MSLCLQPIQLFYQKDGLAVVGHMTAPQYIRPDVRGEGATENVTHSFT
jgi:hypothetical protein